MGLKKMILCLGGLGLAVGGPMGLFSANDYVAGAKKDDAAAPAAEATSNPYPDGSQTNAGVSGAGSTSPVKATTGQKASSVAPASPPSLEQVLRFNATVEWVMQRWPRVSTGLQHMQLQGYRVPLVTGGKLNDIAGSLTYYFNSAQQVERITFRGTTGDPRRLVALAAERFHFTRRLTNDPGLVLYEAVDAYNKPAGTLKIRSAGVIRANQPYTRFKVDFVVDRAE